MFLLLCLLALAAYVDRIYFEMGKFLSREYTENIDAWESVGGAEAAAEPGVGGDVGFGAAAACAGGAGVFAGDHICRARLGRARREIARTVFELLLAMLVFDRLLPQIFFTKTSGRVDCEDFVC